MNNIKISIIIPVYNVEKYLEQCVDSVLSQTYKNIEVVLVDDGSSDNSSSICDKYAKRDNRITVIHKENGGLSDARNAGINIATGQYALFLDSDDFFDDKFALARLVDRISLSKPDVLNYSYKKYYESSGKSIKQFENFDSMPIRLTKKTEQLEYLTSNSLYIASACNKIIKLSLLRSEMMFTKNKLSEDVEWCAKLLLCANSFDFICENFYCYRQREGSISHTIAEKSCTDLKYNILASLSVANNSDEDTRIYIYRYIAYQLSTFVAVQAIAKKCPKDCINELAKYKWLFSYHSENKKVKTLNLISKVLGFRLMCKTIKVTKKLWHR